MSIGYGFNNIPGLVSAFDVGNPKSYSGSGGTWYDLLNPTQTTAGDPYWANNIDSITISLIIQKIASVVGYAEHPVAKWNGAYDKNASFILYHFGDSSGSNNQMHWYGNVNQDVSSGWAQIAPIGTISNGTYNHIVLQHTSVNGAQGWLNGAKTGSRGATGMLGQTILASNNVTAAIGIQGPLASSYSRVHHIQFYNRELTDQEILGLYSALKLRFSTP